MAMHERTSQLDTKRKLYLQNHVEEEQKKTPRRFFSMLPTKHVSKDEINTICMNSVMHRHDVLVLSWLKGIVRHITV